MPEDLWGDLPTGDNLRTPHSILLEQAKVLTEKTSGLLVGEVGRSQRDDTLFSRFRIVAPALNNYSYDVLVISHSIALYPVTVSPSFGGPVIQASNEGQFKAALKQVLGATRIKNVIAGLIAQIRADKSVAES